jgi:acyl carrier protein
MERADLEAKIIRIVAAASNGRVAARDITLGHSFRRDLGLDSSGLIAVIGRVADALGTDEELADAIADTPVFTVGDLVALAERFGRHGEEAS